MKTSIVCTHPEARQPRHQLCPACQELRRQKRLEHARSYNKSYYQNRKSDPVYISAITAWSRHPEQDEYYRNVQRRLSHKTNRARIMKSKYRLTPEQFQDLCAQQGGVCAICKEPPKRKYLCVDHDHATGAIRGLLCDACNKGIGHLRDSADLAKKAAEYLLSPPASAAGVGPARLRDEG